MHNQDLIIYFAEKFFLGFGTTTLIAIVFSIIKSTNLREFLSKFINTSIRIISVLGIIYFFYYLIDFIVFYSSDEATVFNERAVGPYAWAYWMMLIRPFVFCLLTQLFWIKKIQNTKWLIFLNTLFIFIIVLGSGANFERFVILLTSFHRDYLPSSWSTMDSDFIFSDSLLFIFIPLLAAFENIVLFSSIVFILWVVKSNNNIRKMNNIKSLKSYHLLWIFALISIIISFFEYFLLKESTIDINVHDTYFVIAHFHITYLIFTVLFILGFLYYLFYRIELKLIRALTRIHVFITCFSLPVYYIGNIFNSIKTKNNVPPLFDDISYTNIFISILILVVIIAQLLFILNLLFSLIRHFFKKL